MAQHNKHDEKEPHPAEQHEAAPPSDTYRCKVFNPTQRIRVIYGGALAEVAVVIPPGATVECDLADGLIETLEKQENADPDEPGLKVTELGPTPDAPPPHEAGGSRRTRPRPAKTA